MDEPVEKPGRRRPGQHSLAPGSPTARVSRSAAITCCIFCSPAPSYESALVEQTKTLTQGKIADLSALIRKGQTWEVSEKRD